MTLILPLPQTPIVEDVYESVMGQLSGHGITISDDSQTIVNSETLWVTHNGVLWEVSDDVRFYRKVP